MTERDLVRAIARCEKGAEMTLEMAMSEPATIARSQADDFFAVLPLIRQHRHLCVLGDREPLGSITTDSLFQTLDPPEFLERRRVEEAMERQICCAWDDATLSQVARQIIETGAECAVIVEVPTSERRTTVPTWPGNGSLNPIGLIRDRDLVRFQASELDFSQTLAQTVLEGFPSAIAPHTSLHAAYLTLKQQRGYGIVRGDNGKLVGVLTPHSLLQALAPERIYETLQQLHQEVKQRDRLHPSHSQRQRHIEENALPLHNPTERERLLDAVALRIRSSLNLNEILNATVTEVRQLLQTDRVLIYRLEPDGSGKVAVESVREPQRSILGQVVRDACFEERWLAPYRKPGLARAIEDIETAKIEPCHRRFLAGFDVRANLVVPIVLGECGKGEITSSVRNSDFEVQNSELGTQPPLWGLLIAHECQEPRAWQTSEIELLQQLATQVAIAIQQATLVEKLQTELQERARAEETIRFQAHLLEAVEQAVITTDLEGKITYWNRYAELLYGWTAAEVLNRSILDVTTAETTKGQATEIMVRLQQGKSWCGEIQLQRKDGATFYAIVTDSPIYDESGTLIGIIGVSRDISDRRKTEEALRRSEEHLRLSLEASEMGTWDWDLVRDRVVWSEGHEILFGLAPGTFDGTRKTF
ncbi:MAG: PAS domain S-box protein, partial [Cyanobacteriota bacterium]|nr:PAS domain S-box protein [Cyanobacteriota bacterium]